MMAFCACAVVTSPANTTAFKDVTPLCPVVRLTVGVPPPPPIPPIEGCGVDAPVKLGLLESPN